MLDLARPKPARSPPNWPPSPAPAWCCPAPSPSGAPAAAGTAAPAAPTRLGCTARTGSEPARSPPAASAAGSAPASARTTRPGSTTTGGCATCSPGSRNSVPPPSTPTLDGSATPGPAHAAPGKPARNSAATTRLTCRQPRHHPLFPQVTAEREDLTRLWDPDLVFLAGDVILWCGSGPMVARCLLVCRIPALAWLHRPAARWCCCSDRCGRGADELMSGGYDVVSVQYPRFDPPLSPI